MHRPRRAGSTTARHVALLRAINVGGRNVRMDVLRKAFESLGFTSVETFIASGNVIFDVPAGSSLPQLEKQIEDGLAAALGYEVATFVRTPAELAAIAAYEPFTAAATNGARALYVGFLHAPLSAAAREKLLALRSGTDDFHVHGREFFWLSREGMGVSKISSTVLERVLGARTTTRNVTTVRKLAEKYAPAR